MNKNEEIRWDIRRILKNSKLAETFIVFEKLLKHSISKAANSLRHSSISDKTSKLAETFSKSWKHMKNTTPKQLKEEKNERQDRESRKKRSRGRQETPKRAPRSYHPSPLSLFGCFPGSARWAPWRLLDGSWRCLGDPKARLGGPGRDLGGTHIIGVPFFPTCGPGAMVFGAAAVGRYGKWHVDVSLSAFPWTCHFLLFPFLSSVLLW